MRQVPPAAIIEAALDGLTHAADPNWIPTLRELHALGARKNVLKSIDIGHTDFERGYLLGLEVARAMVASMPAAQVAGVEL